MASFGSRVRSRLAHAWNVFINPEASQPQQQFNPYAKGVSYGTRGSGTGRVNGRGGLQNERSIISSIYTRLAIDAGTVKIKHVQEDDEQHYVSERASGINYCLNIEANIDQAASAFRMDMFVSMFDKGVIAVVPVDTTIDPSLSGGYDINTMRVGEVTAWYPRHVKVSVYNDQIGARQEVILPKTVVAIVENPFYAVMNEQNSTLQRLIRKLNLLDAVDEASSSGKLDLIIQLPYVIKSEARKQQAEQRGTDIAEQLKGSEYGIAYTDGTEKITQLNRPVTNSLMDQITFLTGMLYEQLGLTPAVFDGSATEVVMQNYNNRTIEPLVRAVCEGLARTFLTKTARTQNQTITYYIDPFALIPISALAELADKLTRNEILTSNEFRAIIGYKPSTDPNANKLLNKNLPLIKTETQPNGQPYPNTGTGTTPASSDSGEPVDPDEQLAA